MGSLINIEEEIWPALVKLGAGSFAAVYFDPGNSIAFKIAHAEEHSSTLLQEYHMLNDIYTICNHESFFRFPCPFAFYDPMIKGSLQQVADLQQNHPQFGARSMKLTPTTFSYLPQCQHAVYTMHRAQRIPLEVALKCEEPFYPAAVRDSATTPPPKLCRIYFGKTLPVLENSRFVNSSNFPLDLHRYNTLSELMGLIPASKYGMCQRLSRLHWRGGYDARDVEMIMGGHELCQISFYCIEFNQMRRFNRDDPMKGVEELLDAHFANDPYYPVANPMINFTCRSREDIYPRVGMWGFRFWKHWRRGRL